MFYRYPFAPLLVSRRGNQESYFPMEVACILEGQRVQLQQRTPAQLKNMKVVLFFFIPSSFVAKDSWNIINFFVQGEVAV